MVVKDVSTLMIVAGILAWIIVMSAVSVIVSKIDSAINSPDTQVVDKNLLTVDILIPAICFTEENPATSELTREQKDAGFKSAKVNEDGSVTYTVSKKAFETIKEDMRLSTQKSLDEIPVESESIKSVEYNDDFSKVTFKVDKAVYENSLDSISVSLSSISCKLYQAYAGVSADKIKIVITVVDVTTGEVISTKEYPTSEAE